MTGVDLQQLLLEKWGRSYDIQLRRIKDKVLSIWKLETIVEQIRFCEYWVDHGSTVYFKPEKVLGKHTYHDKPDKVAGLPV